MTELIYTLNENGTIKKLMDRKIVHENGILHAGVQCWLMNERGQILIQRRSATKEQSAGKWDVSFGGHCSKVDSEHNFYLENVLKEAKEELGLTLNPKNIINIGHFRYTSQKNKNKEILAIFLIKISSMQNFVFEDGEVSEVNWIDVLELENNIKNKKNEYANRLGALTLLKLYL